MSIKSRIIRGVLKWLWVRYPCQMKDIVIPEGAHIHLNPGQRAKQEALGGIYKGGITMNTDGEVVA